MLKLPPISEKLFLFVAVFVAGLCSIIYELLISTTSAYFLGDSVKQFSLTIGTYLFAMGVGAFWSQYFRGSVLSLFVGVELLLGLIGGLSVPILYALFPVTTAGQYQYAVLLLTGAIGLLTGFEIPLLTRILKRYYPLRENLANVLGFDYVGALVATLLFPFLLLPFLGLFRSSLVFGAVNVLLGLGVSRFFADRLSTKSRRLWYALAGVVFLVFTLFYLRTERFLGRIDAAAYPHPVIYGERTPYQQITLTQNGDDFRLYLDRVIQFSSRDEYRYHESLALIPSAVAAPVRRALILGGGEGLLARELLKLPQLEALDIVDLDPQIFALARRIPRLREMNEDALFDPRVSTHAQDAFVYLSADTNRYDLILADLPDPGNEGLARLYSTYFFGLARARLQPQGVFATQASSPYHTRQAFWCIVATLEASGFGSVTPYQTTVPSFGPWGFVFATQSATGLEAVDSGQRNGVENMLRREGISTRYLEPELIPAMFHFPRDQARPDPLPAPNTLDRPVLLDLFLADWQRWQREKIIQ